MFDETRREAKIQDWYEDKRTGKPQMKLKTIYIDEYTAHVPNDTYAEYLLPRVAKGREVTRALPDKTEEVKQAEVVQEPEPCKRKRRKKIRYPCSPKLVIESLAQALKNG
jgi:hypothetical protein